MIFHYYEKAGTMLGSEILSVDSYLGIRSILKNNQQIESELKAVAVLANAGEFDTVMINLHKHFFGCPPNSSHGAEVDCLALRRIQ